MQKRLIELSEQRGRLRERIAHQRIALARDLQPLLAPLSLPARLAASARRGWDFLQGHPYVAGSVAVGLLVLKPRFVLRWAQRGLFAWRAWRSVRGMVPGLIRNFLVR
jgi:hypothetical protein